MPIPGALDLFFHSSLAPFARLHELGEQGLEREVERLKRLDRRYSRYALACMLGLTLAGLAMMAGLTMGWTENDVLYGWVLMWAGAGSFVWFMVASYRFEDQAAELDPIAKGESLSCAEALHLTQESLAARAWRDEAVNAGRQLREFDLMAMRRLAELEAREALAEQRRELCAKAHGA